MSMEGAYTPLNFQSATLADFGCKANSTRIEHGYYSSSNVWEFDGIARTYVLVKATAGGITKNLAVHKDTGVTGEITVIVVPSTSGNTLRPWGVNNTGETIVSGNYFWLNTGPEFYWITDGTAVSAAGTLLMCSNATAGTCEPFTLAAGTATVPCAISVTDASAASQPIRCWGRMPVLYQYI